jgi:hypothetical protein
VQQLSSEKLELGPPGTKPGAGPGVVLVTSSHFDLSANQV